MACSVVAGSLSSLAAPGPSDLSWLEAVDRFRLLDQSEVSTAVT